MSKTTENEGAPSVSQYVYPLVAAALRSHAKNWDLSATPSPTPGGGASEGSDVEAQSVTRWDQGVEEGERRVRAEFEQRLAKERESLAQCIQQAEQERARYFQRVEAEVVQLALAIAAKILRREAQVDPLFLRAAVRVALETVASSTEVRMRVHPDQVSHWKDHFASQANTAEPPVLEADDSLELAQCVLETSLGTTDLSWRAQLKEVEESFLDLLNLKPGTP